jgi:hypothetical protein
MSKTSRRPGREAAKEALKKKNFNNANGVGNNAQLVLSSVASQPQPVV